MRLDVAFSSVQNPHFDKRASRAQFSEPTKQDITDAVPVCVEEIPKSLAV